LTSDLIFGYYRPEALKNDVKKLTHFSIAWCSWHGYWCSWHI